ncbi:MAG: hypothetical protein CM1200mP27_10710 [Chloroflexota bacterium]|nr:MAG: hypothetical protein CM1200mP27_10710 [Chloroflexota bacterium]
MGYLRLRNLRSHWPMVRSSADAGIMLQAISGLDPKDPLLSRPSTGYARDIEKGSKVRIGLDDKYISENTDPELVASVLAGIKTLEGLVPRCTVTMPGLSGYMEAWGVLCSSEALAAHESTTPHTEMTTAWFQGWLDNGAQVTGADYAKANNIRSACRGLLNNIFQMLT